MPKQGSFKSMLTFIVPIRHPAGVRNRDEQQRTLTETIRSIAGQKGKRWRAVIVCNPEQRLPPLPERFSVLPVALPFNPALGQAASKDAVYALIRQDKGARVAAAAALLPSDGYMMVVDDDDFVHCDIADHVAKSVSYSGWKISDGYSWAVGSRYAYRVAEFDRLCGTSLIVRNDLYLGFGQTRPCSDALDEYGSHRLISERLEKAGHPLGVLPFHGAIYRTAHSNASQVDVANAQAGRGQKKRSFFVIRLLRKAAGYMFRVRFGKKPQGRVLFGDLSRDFGIDGLDG